MIGLVQDGDEITIDLTTREITLELDEETIATRRAVWTRLHKEVPKGFLRLYRDRVSSAAHGAILK